MMCSKPLLLQSGQLVACRECWQCKQNRIQDWVGRCIAESKVSAHTHVVTLTYGRDDRYEIDHAHAQLLTYSDVQGYLKRLRRQSGPLRFFAAGEYGSRKGRAHWHLIVFWKTKHVAPNIRLNERYVHAGENGRQLWDAGFSFWEDATPESMAYACKYILKDWEPGQQSARGLSTRPPLGANYFVSLAAEYVNSGLSPQNTAYYFAECRMRTGGLIKYMLTGAPAYGFLSAFDRLWQIKHRGRYWPQSDLMDEYEDERDRRARRKLGIADYDEYIFAGRFDLERRERNGTWLQEHRDVNGAALQMSLQNRYHLAKQENLWPDGNRSMNDGQSSALTQV